MKRFTGSLTQKAKQLIRKGCNSCNEQLALNKEAKAMRNNAEQRNQKPGTQKTQPKVQPAKKPTTIKK